MIFWYVDTQWPHPVPSVKHKGKSEERSKESDLSQCPALLLTSYVGLKRNDFFSFGRHIFLENLNPVLFPTGNGKEV